MGTSAMKPWEEYQQTEFSPKGHGPWEDYQVPQKNPSAFEKYGKALQTGGAVVGGLLGNVPGAILGGAGGEAARQLLGRAMGEQTPQTSMAAAKDIGIEGAISGATEGGTRLLGMAARPLAEPFGNMMSRVGKTGAELTEAVTGLKVPDVMQAARQGVKTYLAPGMGKAQEIFGGALEKAGIKSRPPLNQILDPQLGVARKIALEVGSKLEKGGQISAEEALRARQATDRIIAGTPIKDRATRGSLMELRNTFDEALSSRSGSLKDASVKYRQAIVKRNLLNPMRITKQGQMSAVAPLLASTVGSTVGVSRKSPGEGFGAGALTMAAGSPLLWGAGITAGADVTRAATAPLSRRALIQLAIRKLIRDKSPMQQPGQ